jgi:hypothetical protein
LTNPFWHVSISLNNSSKIALRLLVIALSTLLSPVELGWSQPSLFGFGRCFKNRVGHRSNRLAPRARSPCVGTAVAGTGRGRPVAAGRLARSEGAALHLGLALAGLGWLRPGSRHSVHATRVGQAATPCAGPNRGHGCRGMVDMVFSPPLVPTTTSSLGHVLLPHGWSRARCQW